MKRFHIPNLIDERRNSKGSENRLVFYYFSASLFYEEKLETLIISCSLRENYLIFEVQYKHNYYEHMIQEATYDVPVMLGKIFIFMTLYTLLLDR